MTPLATSAAARDFDFLHGHWRVHNRRLRARLAGCDDWDGFEARVETRPLPGGLGNREHFHTDWDGGYHGLAIRLFEPASGQWRIWWASDRSPLLEAPVVGAFKGDVGTFLSRITHAGRPVLCRYRWTRIDGDHARWDQAYALLDDLSDAGAIEHGAPGLGHSGDGLHWEANWEMDFRRVHGAAPLQP